MTLSRRKTLALDRRRCSSSPPRAASPSRSPARSGPRCALGPRGSTTIRACARSAGRSSRRIRTTCSRGRWTCRCRVRRCFTPISTACCRNGPVQSADHRIAGLFSGASAHGGACRTGSPSRSTCSPKARTPRASTNARSRSAASAHATAAPDPLFVMPPPAQQQGTLRHVPPGPGRGAGAHRLGRAAYRGRGLRRSGTGRGASRLTVRAMEIEIDTPHTFAESVEVFRIGRREVDANPDGLEFHGPDVRGDAPFRAVHAGGGMRPRQHRVPAGHAPPCWRPSPPPWPTSGP
jgi:hypothetical protein